MDIAAYVGGESKGGGTGRTIKLSSNENPFGPSPKALAALNPQSLALEKYPDGGCTELRAALAQKFGLEEGRIVCGAGSDEIILLLCKAYLGVGDEILYNRHGFLMYGIAAQACGAKPVTAAERDLKIDVQALLDAVTPQTKILFLANPNNPTGSYLSTDEVKALRAALRDDILLVIDAAYAEYAEVETDYDSGFDLARGADNIVVLRTFSKIYGLAGLRLGWGYCPEAVADVLNRVRGPFNVSSVAQIAGVAALQDVDFITKSVAHTTERRAKTAQTLSGFGLKVWPSAANFILVSFETPDKAETCRLFLKDRGILVRQMGAYQLPESLRISIGAGDEMTLACEAIEGYLKTL